MFRRSYWTSDDKRTATIEGDVPRTGAKTNPVGPDSTGSFRQNASSAYFFTGSPDTPSFLTIPSFFIMSAHMVSFFIIASSFFTPSLVDIAM